MVDRNVEGRVHVIVWVIGIAPFTQRWTAVRSLSGTVEISPHIRIADNYPCFLVGIMLKQIWTTIYCLHQSQLRLVVEASVRASNPGLSRGNSKFPYDI